MLNGDELPLSKSISLILLLPPEIEAIRTEKLIEF